MDSRVVKPKLPLRTVLIAVFFGLLVFGFVVSAVWFSVNGIQDARMTGTVVAKKFEPNPENQITIGRNGGAITATRTEGNFLITVEVPQRDGTRRPFIVDMRDREKFDAVNVGDTFDVGPYLVRE